jgi:RNA-directed DNA polymerase
VEQFLSERGLELSHEKTKITPMEDGFDFLGQTIRRQRNGKVLIQPSKRSVQTFLSKIQETIDHSGSQTAGDLIGRLNQQIKGWTMYHRFAVSRRIFAAVDDRIFGKLRRWCRKRQPNKSWGWIKKKYFQRAGDRDWVFTGVIQDSEGKVGPIRRVKAAGVQILRGGRSGRKPTRTIRRGNCTWRSGWPGRWATLLQGGTGLITYGRVKMASAWSADQRPTTVAG